MIKVYRPPASEKKINTSDDFELCFLRHQYFRRVEYNPTPEEMQPYMKIVDHLTKNTFYTYFNLFKAVGMYHEDVLNIGRVHLVSFLGLYSMDTNKAKKDEYIERIIRYEFRVPGESDFLQKNRANFTMFFKQRMEDLVRVCRQKVRNIKGQSSEEYQVFCGSVMPPKNTESLPKTYKEIGYKKVDFSVFKSIRKQAKVNSDATIFQFGDLWYVAVALEQKSLELGDIVGSEWNPYDNIYNMQPDEILTEQENNILEERFYDKTNDRKRIVLRKFIAKNKLKRQYREEISTARKILKGLGE